MDVFSHPIFASIVRFSMSYSDSIKQLPEKENHSSDVYVGAFLSFGNGHRLGAVRANEAWVMLDDLKIILGGIGALVFISCALSALLQSAPVPNSQPLQGDEASANEKES